MNLYRVEVADNPATNASKACGWPVRTFYVLAYSTEQAMLLGRAKFQSCNRIRLVELLAESHDIIMVRSPEQTCMELQ